MTAAILVFLAFGIVAIGIGVALALSSPWDETDIGASEDATVPVQERYTA